jgi:hypothetical protein
MLALTWALRKHPSLVRRVLWLGILAAVILATVFVVEPGPWVGLVQRGIGTFVAAWLVLVLLALRTVGTGPSSSNPRSP